MTEDRPKGYGKAFLESMYPEGLLVCGAGGVSNRSEDDLTEMNRQNAERYLRERLPRGVGIQTITMSESVLREQASYRNGWEAGERKAHAEIGALKTQVEHFRNLANFWSDKCISADIDGDRSEPCNENPIDLDRMRYESRASSDHAASKALVEQEPWHAGLDQDDP